MIDVAALKTENDALHIQIAEVDRLEEETNQLITAGMGGYLARILTATEAILQLKKASGKEFQAVQKVNDMEKHIKKARGIIDLELQDLRKAK